MTQKQFLSSVVFLIATSLILFFIQSGVVRWLSDTYEFKYAVWQIYVFHFFITLFVFSLLHLVGKIFPKYIGFTFMGLILLKMIAAIVFLLPLIKMKTGSKIPDFISFFVPYFIFLILEILLTMKILKASEDKFIDKTNIPKNNNA